MKSRKILFTLLGMAFAMIAIAIPAFAAEGDAGTYTPKQYAHVANYSSLEYIPVDKSRFTFYEYTHGRPDKDKNGHEYWQYTTPGLKEGDLLIVHKTDGTSITYVCTERHEELDFIKQGGSETDGDYIIGGDEFPYFLAHETAIGPGTYNDLFVFTINGCKGSYPITITEYPSLSDARADMKKRLTAEYNRLMTEDYYSPDGLVLVEKYYKDGLAAIDNAPTKWDAANAYYDATTNGMWDVEFDYVAPGHTKTIADTVITLNQSTYEYNGTARKPAVKVTWGELILQKDDLYSVKYQNNVNAGTATVIVSGIKPFTGSKKVTFTIKPARQNLKITTGSLKVKYKSLKKKAQQTGKVKVSGAKTKLTYAKASGSPKLSINKTTGKIIVAKKTKKGTYKIKVKITAAKTTNYKGSSAAKQIKVVVK